VEFDTLDGNAVEDAFDSLCRLYEPEDSVEKPMAIARVSVLPTGLEQTANVLGRMLEESSSTAHQIAADVGAGQLCLRWDGEAGTLDDPLKKLPDLIRDAGGCGWLVYLPTELRGRWEYLLLEDPNRATAARVLKVFDPSAIFCPGRMYKKAAALTR
jgi:hypothetical protein